MIDTRPAEHWDQRYLDNDLPWDTRRPEPRLTELVTALDVPRAVAMDMGCGTGDNAMWLAQNGFETIGVDLSAVAIETARARAGEAGLNNVRFESGSVLDELPVERGSVGVVLDRGCFHAIGDDDRGLYARRVAEALAPGGWWLMMCGNADEQRAEGEEGPPQLSATRIAGVVEEHFEIHALERSRFTASDGQAKRMAWRGVLRRR